MKVAKEHGARVINAVPGVNRGAYAQDARNPWILCLLPHEAVAEDLEASLLEWADVEQDAGQMGFNMAIREQNGAGWKSVDPELRLANRKQINWTGRFAAEQPQSASAGRIHPPHP